MRVALEIDGQSALAWLLKGEALVGKGDYAQAEGTLKRAKELDPSNTKADQLLAEIRTALAAGFRGGRDEPIETKEYPASRSAAARGRHGRVHTSAGRRSTRSTTRSCWPTPTPRPG